MVKFQIKKAFLLLIIFFVISGSILVPANAAPPSNEKYKDARGDTQQENTINIGKVFETSNLGIQTNDKTGLVGTILKNILTIFFTVGGIGTVIYFLWGAVDWILSGGDKEKVSNARKKMTHAIIGLALLSLSFVIIRVVGEIVGFNPLDLTKPLQINRLDEK